jgi:cellulose biosynthesis protein BcsQ
MYKVYGVGIRKGGQGKSTTVATLSRLCAMQGARVLVMDLAQPGSATTSFRDLWPDAEHADLSHALLAFRALAQGEAPDAATCQEVLANSCLPVPLRSLPSWGSGGIAVLPHDELLGEAAAYLPSDLILRGLIASQLDHFDVVLIDLPMDGVSLLGNALAATERIIMPLVPESPALEGADATLRLLARVRAAGLPVSLGGVLLTRCDPKSKRAADVVRTLTRSGEVEGEPLHRKLFPFAARQSEYFEQAFRYGVPVWERTDDPSHWSAYALLADWLLRDAGLSHLAESPRLAMRLEDETRILDSMALGLGRSEVAYRDFREARAPLPV